MGVVMAHLRQLTEQYDSVLMPIHHQRKDHGAGGRAGDRLRGHSAIEAALDLALLVERDEGSNAITIRSTKTRGADVLPFGAMFTYEHAPGTSDLYTARFYGMPVADERSDQAIRRTIRAVLTSPPELPKTELAQRVHAHVPTIGVNRIRGVIEQMLVQRQLLVRVGARGSQWVSRPSAGGDIRRPDLQGV
jgi:hypothetical protein